MKIGFIGIGKLGKDAAEVMSYHHDVIGYDIQKVEIVISKSPEVIRRRKT